MPDPINTYQFGVSDRLIAALVADKIIPAGQEVRVQAVTIDAKSYRHARVTVTMIATEEFLKCLPCPTP
jgi:hypothetical protein